MAIQIPFNKPHVTGNETKYIADAVATGKLSGNGLFTQKCQKFFESQLGSPKTFLTTSCTDALEMSAILANIQPGDEVIMPSYTFVSTANAFVLRGAKIIFIDSSKDHPGMDEKLLESLITPKTKAIVPVHYAGVACNMEEIMKIAEKYSLHVIEDAAQAIDSYFIDSQGNRKPLGSIGHLSAFSFHETKNISSGEGGLLSVNDERFQKRAEIIWEKGTNRAAFFRGEIDKYRWVDVGSSFLPSEITAAFLWAQLEQMADIQAKRKKIYDTYHNELKDWGNSLGLRFPFIPSYATNNYHMFYLVFPEEPLRARFISHLKNNGILAVYHYISLHNSDFYKKLSGRNDYLPMSDLYTETLVRLPFYYGLTDNEINKVVGCIKEFRA